MSRTVKLYLLALVVAVPALQVATMPLLMIIGPFRGFFPWGLIVEYLLLVLLIKWLFSKTTIFGGASSKSSLSVDSRTASSSVTLRQYALATWAAFMLSGVLMPLLMMPLMLVQIGFYDSPMWRLLLPLFNIGAFLALVMVCKYFIERAWTKQQQRAQQRADLTMAGIVATTGGAESAPPQARRESAVAALPADERMKKIERISRRLAVACPAAMAVLLLLFEILGGGKMWLTSAFFMFFIGAIIAVLLYPGIKTILSLRLNMEPPRHLLKHLLNAICLLLLFCAFCPFLWTPSVLALGLFALLLWSLFLRGLVPYRTWWRRIGFVAAAVVAIALLYSVGSLTDSDFTRIDWLTAYAVTVIAVGLVFCVSLYNQLARGERIGYLLLLLLIAAGLVHVAQLPFLSETHNVVGGVTAVGTTERFGTEVEILGTFMEREWTIARTVTDEKGTYCFTDAKEFVTLVEAKRGADHGFRGCMGGVVLRFTRNGYEPYSLRNEYSQQPPMMMDGVVYYRLADVQLQPRSPQTLPAAAIESRIENQMYQRYRGLSGYEDDRKNWENLLRDPNMPRDEIEARIIACRFAETENTLFLEAASQRQAYRRIIDDAETWLSTNHESPYRVTVLTVKASVHHRCGEEERYRETVAALQQYAPAADWQRQLAAMEARP